MRRRAHLWLGALCSGCLAVAALAGQPLPVAHQLALELARDGDHASAAIEFHRCALAAGSASAQAGYFIAAAQERLLADAPARALDLLDRAEDADPEVAEVASLLRAGAEWAQGHPREAGFYLANAYPELDDEALRTFARRQLAAVQLADGDPDRAARALTAVDAAATDAVVAYVEGRDKNPRLGGWLGLVPGLGYAYAGEYANAFRSLVLNAIFLYGMADTADDEEWGAFTVITAIEFTWYSGSVYGGIDASHRYNRRRLDNATSGITGDARLAVDRAMIPVAVLKIEF